MVSKRLLRRRQCGYKQRHPTREQPIAHVVSLAYAGSSGLQPYRCRWCGFFHVGHWHPREDR